MIYLNIDCSLGILLKTPNSSLSSREKLKSISLNKLIPNSVDLHLKYRRLLILSSLSL